MRDEFSKIKYYINFAETCLKRANREWAYYKNGHPYNQMNDNANHYLKSQKAYSATKDLLEKAAALLKETPNKELEEKVKSMSLCCNKRK